MREQALPEASTDGFFTYDLRIGTIIEATINAKARVHAYVLRIDFGPLGHKTSSAQLTRRYQPEGLVGRQVVAVINFPPRRIAGVVSEVLVLGGLPGEGDVVLLQPDCELANGTSIA